jgi:hypothetical protein
MRVNAPGSRRWIREGFALAVLAAGMLAFFWPVLLGRVIPAPGDGIVHAFPHLALLGRALAAGELPLWNPYEFSGFPWLATGQAGVLYPPNWIAALLPAPRAMSLVVLSTYLIAGAGTYRLARHLGAPPLAATVGGYTYALSGFMIAHLGHTPMINAAAWLPWVFLAVERLRSRMRWPWFAASAGFVALQVAAGHFQVPVYGGLAVAIYVLVAGGEVPGWRARVGWLGRVGLAGMTGGLLAAVQILPALELAGESARARITYEFFSEYALPVRELSLLLFPYLLGGAPPPSPFPAPYSGRWGLTELTGYAGVFPFALAVSASIALWRQPRVRGWAVVGVTTLVLALGPGTPVHRLLFIVPGYNQFRVPARHLMSFGLAVGILAALALGRMLDRQAEGMRRDASRCAGGVAAGMGLIAVAILVRPGLLEPVLPPSPAGAPAWGPGLWVPLGLAGLTLLVVGLLRRTQSLPVQGLALVLTLVDLGSFGQFYEWRVYPSLSSLGQVSAPVAFLQRAAEDPPRRIFTAVREFPGDFAPLGMPMFVAIHGLESANGYDPLILSRYANFLGMSAGGTVPEVWRTARGRPLDLLAVRHVLVPSRRLYATRDGPVTALGPGEALEFGVPEGDPVGLSAITAYAHEGEVREGTPVAKVAAFAEGAEPVTWVLRAGMETGAWDARGPTSPPRAGRAVQRVTAGEGGNPVSVYEARLPMGQPRRIVRVRIEQAAALPKLVLGVVALRGIGQDGQALPLTGPTATVPIPAHWVRVFRDASAEVFANPRALPRAWIVPRTMVLGDAAAVLDVIRTGRLPDGGAFDPRAVALLSGRDASPGLPGGAGRAGEVQVRSWSANRMAVEVRAPAGGYLVLSEVDYPGWRAALDGVPVRHDRVNYLLRGLPIPPGTHRVTFVFRPRSVVWGGLITAATGAALFSVAWPRRRRA